MNPLHYFPFYYRDFFEDENVRLMSNAQVGIYLKLLSHQWHEGSIPSNLGALVAITGTIIESLPTDQHEEATARLNDMQWVVDMCFIKARTGRLQNPRMERIRAKQIENTKKYHDRAVTAGKASAQARLVQHKFNSSSTQVNHSDSESYTDSESESESDTETKKRKNKSCGEVGQPRPPAKSTETWTAYSEAYRRRYGVDPVRNQSVNAQLCRVVQQLGHEAAPQIAAFYLTHNDPFYVRARHPPTLLVRDAAGLHTQWATGIKATPGEAKNAIAQDYAREQIKRVEAMMKGGSV